MSTEVRHAVVLSASSVYSSKMHCVIVSYVLSVPAEQFLEQLEGNANYPVLLLTLTSRPDAQVAPPVKLAAAINLKNLVKRRWQTVSIKLSLHQLYEI